MDVGAPSWRERVVETGPGLLTARSTTRPGDGRGGGVLRARSVVLATGGLSALTVTSAGTGLERTIVAPSITQSIGEDFQVTGAVVLAYQYFASWGLGSSLVDVNSSPLPPGYAESTFGTGVRLGFQQRVSDVLGFTAEFQTKVDMDAFENYRGVYATLTVNLSANL